MAAVARSQIQSVPEDLDLFKDGTVRFLSTPGHTPGHHSLMLQLHKSGTVILSGDVAHFQENYNKSLVPLGNVSRAETIASIGRIKGLAAHYRARVIIQHSDNIFRAMPKLPYYLD